MSDLPNGFTGFSKRGPNFVSASDAIRQAEREHRMEERRPSGARPSTAGWQANVARPAAREHVAGVWGATPGSQAGAGIGRFLREPEGDSPDDAAPGFDPEKLATIGALDRRWAWIEVNLAAIRHNIAEIKRRLKPGVRLMAVVKGDAYGHGAPQVAKMALNSGAEYLSVATVDEAIQLREALINAPILILSEPPMASIPLLLAYKVMPTVYTAEFAVQYAEAADAVGLRAPFHLKVNTGMNRIGVHYDEVVSFMHQVGFHRALELVGTFTHFATAASSETLDFGIQCKRFAEAINAMKAAGIDPGIVHAANSAAAIRYPEVHFDMVRWGISLYGYHPSRETVGMVDLKPAMSVHARVTDTKLVPMSDGVSHGLHYRSPGSVKICTVPIGYADGLRVGLSGNTYFIVGGQMLRQVGSICMDQCMFEVDLRSYASRRRVDPQIGDEVIVVGAQDGAAIWLDELADQLGANPYELLVGFGCSRLPRIYK